MTCHQVQVSLSLYLYGELDFAQEEALERHVAGCALCQRFLAREKAWHTSANSGVSDVPIDLLMQCRQELRATITQGGAKRKTNHLSWVTWAEPFGMTAGRWSVRLALASFLVFIGFTSARWFGRNGFMGSIDGGKTNNMSLLNPSSAHIRDIRPGNNHQVRILVQQVNEREVTGTPEDDSIRRLLLAAMQDTDDPGLRVDSVEVLQGQGGTDVRDALIRTVRRDPNAAVRLKALEALRQFSSDTATRDALKFVLQHDENADVRSEAIDILAPLNQKLDITPDLAATLQEIMRSEPESDYVRARCLQVLHDVNAPLNVY
ncbi:MAG TPA: HEAT repeat domain-containing protein [Bryobacteraceae bacterium]|nr:HEAT repeat domain-containing protein [Bryobacteraceae bacterium]